MNKKSSSEACIRSFNADYPGFFFHTVSSMKPTPIFPVGIQFLEFQWFLHFFVFVSLTNLMPYYLSALHANFSFCIFISSIIT